MSVSSGNEADNVISRTDRSSSNADGMKSHSFVPSRLTLSVYHRLTSFAVSCMSLSATAVLIFLLLFWYYGGIILLCALLIALLGETCYCLLFSVARWCSG